MTDKATAAAFFVDADNVSPAVVALAFDDLQQRFTVGVRRAYGGPQKLTDMRDVLLKCGIRGLVNQGKGTTDVSLVVDVMDLLHGAVLPGVVALASSDADFAPLALRLREAGIRVLCYAQRDKVAEAELRPAYDEVLVVGEIAVISPAHQVTPPKPNPKVEADRETVRQILATFPDWAVGEAKPLNQLGGPLRKQDIKRGSKPLHELFAKHPQYFELLPAQGPRSQVRLLRRP